MYIYYILKYIYIYSHTHVYTYTYMHVKNNEKRGNNLKESREGHTSVFGLRKGKKEIIYILISKIKEIKMRSRYIKGLFW